MMKKIAAVLTLCLLVFALASCGSADNSKIIGTYDLVSASGNRINVTQDQIDTLKAIGMTATLEVNDDGTAVMNLFDKKYDMTYDISKMIFVIDGKNAKFKCDGTTLTLSDSDAKLVFEKRS